MLIQVRFINNGDATYDGKIRLQMTDNAAGPTGSWQMWWEVVGPAGQTIKALPVSPDASFGNNQTASVYVDIPLDSNDEYMAGTYTFTWQYKDSGALDDPTEGTYTFDYAPAVTPDNQDIATMTASFNCLNGKITVQDTTDNTGYTVDDRLISVLPPQIAGQPAPVADTTDTELYEGTFSWNNAPYQVSLAVTRHLEEDAGGMTFYVDEIVYANTTLNIVCDTSFCDAAACLEAEYNKLDDLACASGSWANIPAADKAKGEQALYRVVLGLAYRQCGDFNKSAAFSALAATCDCGCGGSTTASSATKPTPYTPPIA